MASWPILNQESRGYRERGGIKAKRAGSGGEGLGLIPTEGYNFPFLSVFIDFVVISSGKVKFSMASCISIIEKKVDGPTFILR